MLIRRRPAANSEAASGASKIPLVVSPRSVIPGIASRRATRRGRSRRTSGSPPVRRIFLIPRPAATPDDALDLLEGQKLVAGEEGDRLGHAVNAADVAAVGDADPEVRVDPTKRVDESISGRDRGRGHGVANSGAVDRSRSIPGTHHTPAQPRCDHPRRGNQASRCTGFDPFLGPVGPFFLLPDRDHFLDRVDQPAAGVERLRPVRCADRDHDGDLTGPERTDAVDDRQPLDRPPLQRLRRQVVEQAFGPSRRRLRIRARSFACRPSVRERSPGTSRPPPAWRDRTESVIAPWSIRSGVIVIDARESAIPPLTGGIRATSDAAVIGSASSAYAAFTAIRAEPTTSPSAGQAWTRACFNWPTVAGSASSTSSEAEPARARPAANNSTVSRTGGTPLRMRDDDR